MNLNRRKLLQVAAATTIGTAIISLLDRSSSAKTARLTAQANSLAAEVEQALAYFKDQASKQLPEAEALISAIAPNDLAAAKNAYIESRPPYEQIEVLALNFEATDTNIDARPYAFNKGEEDEAFMDFHRIETLIFRD